LICFGVILPSSMKSSSLKSRKDNHTVNNFVLQEVVDLS
jgi:hypothetical protein